ncbi:MAG: c-type cytochrome [Bdellovibrionaceae bacterium]|nr:c-type cytochrome [Pseudobdellovibrionaceae bacterium]
MIRNLGKSVSYGFIFITALVLFSACDNKGPHQPLKTQPTGSNKGGVSQESDKTIIGPSYQDIQTLLQNKCGACHDWHTNQAKLEATIIKGTLIEFIWEKKNVPAAMEAFLKNSLSDEERAQIRDYALAFLYQQKVAKTQTGKAKAPKTKKVAVGDKTTAPASASSDKISKAELDQLSDEEKFNTISSCTACHGVTGISEIDETSKTNSVPNLAGLSAAYISQQLKAFKQVRMDEKGELVIQGSDLNVVARKDSTPAHIMNLITQDLTEAQIELVAQHFSKMEANQGTKEDSDGKFNNCLGCHTGQAESMGPRIRGQKAEYLANQLRAFKTSTGIRKNAIMSGVADQIDDKDIESLAKYISELKTQ